MDRHAQQQAWSQAQPGRDEHSPARREADEQRAVGPSTAACRAERTQHKHPGHYVLFYDGSCGLCRRAIYLIKRRQPQAFIEFVDVNDVREMERFPQVDRKRALDRVVLMRPGGQQQSAYNAVTGVLELLPRWRRVHFLLRLWPVRLAGHAMYHLVGDHRHRISRWMGWD